jgi:hypothetical protein
MYPRSSLYLTECRDNILAYLPINEHYEVSNKSIGRSNMNVTAIFFLSIISTASMPKFGEIYVPQLPNDRRDQVIVDQLPETAVVPSSEDRRNGADSKRSTLKASLQLARPRSTPIHSIFPSVGAGVTAQADPAPSDRSLPSVGRGVNSD